MPSPLRATAAMETIITNRIQEADDVISLTLARKDQQPLPPWDPGAHVDLILSDGTTRQYSLCGDPGDLSEYRVAVLRQPEGKGGSEKVHQQCQRGSSIMISAPRNRFHLVPAASYVLIAGGIGITPLLAMAHQLNRSRLPWRLIYGGRTTASMAFRELLDQFDTVELLPEDECGLLDLETIAKSAEPDSAIYCCGPSGMIKALESLTNTFPPGVSLHSEQFTSSESDGSAQPGDNTQDCPFQVVMSRTGSTITVEPGQSILEAARQVTPSLVSSCEEGHCGTCETSVLSGLPDHRDEFLTDDERDSNETIMICVSRSRTEEITLNL